MLNLEAGRGVTDDARVCTGLTVPLDEDCDRGTAGPPPLLAAVGRVLPLVGGVASCGVTGTLGVTTGSASPALPAG